MKTTWIKAVFWASAVYDLVLGVVFLVAAEQVFEHYGVPLPNHAGYIQFPAIILVIFGVMFARIAMDPRRFRELMWYGVGLKAAYAGVVLYHQATGGVPSMWLPFAYIDVVFIVAFVWAWKSVEDKAE